MSFTVQLPLNKATNSTYINIDEVRGMVKQNVKNLLLTTPGERVMLPLFGAGLKRYLFENVDSASIESEIIAGISYQFERYLSSVKLLDVAVRQEDNFLLVKVFYSLREFNIQDFLQIRLEN
tara:strand:+ start:40 stop:405 length:366 start_codon:yes stop_codon:yes gene_type:complete